MKLSNARTLPAYSSHEQHDHPVVVGRYVIADGEPLDDGTVPTMAYRVAGTKLAKVLDEHTAACIVERVELDGKDDNAYWTRIDWIE